jgi:aspartate racemase
MRTLGIIGGMSWESSALYYRLINEAVRKKLGGLNSAPILLHSFNFADIEPLQMQGRWEEAGDLLVHAAAGLQANGADAILLATNTMHKLADQIVARVSAPLLHIADCTVERLITAGVKRAALLGTRFTMTEDFYGDRLAKHGIEAIVPSPADITIVNDVIYNELCQGRVLDHSRVVYQRVIADLVGRGAEAAILGCTEITMLISPHDAPVPTFDTTVIHAEAAAAFAIGDH